MSSHNAGSTGPLLKRGLWDAGNAQFHEVHGALVTISPGHAASTGLVPDEAVTLKFGYNPDIDTAAGEDINYFGDLTYLTAASTLTIVSDSSADDETTGTGAWEVTINYLDSAYEAQTMVYALDGLTPVVTTETALRITSAFCGRVGSGGVNAGNIAITATTGGSTQGYIPIGAGQTQQANITIPAGKTAYFIGGQFSVGETRGGAQKEASAFIESDLRLYNELSTNNYNSWRELFHVIVNNHGAGAPYLSQDVYNPIPEKTDVRFRAQVGVNDTEVTARLFIIFRDN